MTSASLVHLLWLARWLALASLTVLLLLTACGRGPAPDAIASAGSNAAPAGIQGDLIVPLTPPGSPAEPGADAAATRFGAEVAALPVPIPIPLPAGYETNGTGLLPLSFDTLSAFPYQVRLSDPEPGTQRQVLVTDDVIPEVIRALDGRRILIAGYVAPLRTQGRGLTQFLLARDPLSCCFGPSPQMNHWIQVTLPRTEQRFRMFQAVTVVGTLSVGELERNGSLQSIYRLAGERAELMSDIVVPTDLSPAAP